MNIIDWPCPTAKLIDKPGFYRMTAAQYHADPCVWPSLSSSIAKKVLKRPSLARANHPRFTPQPPDDGTAAMHLGSAVHTILLGKGAKIALIEAKDWRTGKAQEARLHAFKIGKIPLLAAQFDAACIIAEKAREGIDNIAGAKGALTGGEIELVAIWQEPNGAWCRAMFDHFKAIPVMSGGEDSHHIYIDDLKTSGDDLSADDIGRKIANMGYHLSAAFYARGVNAILGPRAKIKFTFIFVETAPPYEVLATVLDGAAEETGRRQTLAAIHLWRQCQLENNWPGFPLEVVRAELPGWYPAAWEAREQIDPALADVNYGG